MKVYIPEIIILEVMHSNKDRENKVEIANGETENLCEGCVGVELCMVFHRRSLGHICGCGVRVTQSKSSDFKRKKTHIFCNGKMWKREKN